MAHPSTFRSIFWAASTCMLLAAAAPATAGYKLLIKGPVCSGPGYCATGELAGDGVISISLPAYEDPNTPASPDMPALTFTGNVRLQQTVSQMCKPGTNGQPEWLQAGSNVKGRDWHPVRNGCIQRRLCPGIDLRPHGQPQHCMQYRNPGSGNRTVFAWLFDYEKWPAADYCGQ
jgi:hypothetical protein